jgi:hypothetical protein
VPKELRMAASWKMNFSREDEELGATTAFNRNSYSFCLPSAASVPSSIARAHAC